MPKGFELIKKNKEKELLDLPTELLEKIYEEVPPQNYKNVALSCKRMNLISKNIRCKTIDNYLGNRWIKNHRRWIIRNYPQEKPCCRIKLLQLLLEALDNPRHPLKKCCLCWYCPLCRCKNPRKYRNYVFKDKENRPWLYPGPIEKWIPPKLNKECFTCNCNMIIQ